MAEMVVVPQSRYHSPNVRVTFPDPGGHDAVVFYGAPWPVYDTATIGNWILDEISFARSAISLGVPALGICFGGQMLATAIGGSVSPSPAPEIGWISVSGDPSAMIEAGPWFSWHYDRFTLPAGVAALARTPVADQAFLTGRTLGLQFHPEVTESVLDSWYSAGGRALLARVGIDAGELAAQTRALADGAAARAHSLVRRFVTDVARRPVAALPAELTMPA